MNTPSRRAARRTEQRFRAICLAAATLLSVAACSPIEFDVGGQFSNGEPFLGRGIANFSGEGVIIIEKDGEQCRGTFYSFDNSEHLTVPLTCTRGITGTAEIDRKRSDGMMAGQGTFRLSDGRAGVVWYNVGKSDSFSTGG